jgi:hypothetical protein
MRSLHFPFPLTTCMTTTRWFSTLNKFRENVVPSHWAIKVVAFESCSLIHKYVDTNCEVNDSLAVKRLSNLGYYLRNRTM